MTRIKRPAANSTSQRGMGSGVYLARVVSHIDPTFGGGLHVTLLREQGNKLADDNQVYPVRFASPFFGATGYEFMGKNTASTSNTFDAYNDTQKSYGMWFVPPDVGVTVLVIFVEGDPSAGYWIGCVPPRFANNMVPGIAASSNIDIDNTDKKKYNTQQPLPVAEINRKINATGEQRIDTDKIKKPIHPIADRFLDQGLLEDDIRGFTTSSARREVPSSVYGISTPGPLDKRPGAKKALIGKIQAQTENPVPVSRLGGTQLIFDDGDDRFQRKKSAGELGQGNAYADILNKEKGDPAIPYSEYFRVRTRTGHQILLHNSEDLIYIGNARGTAWVELTSNGKIDIYSQDSISIHTENDLNIRADRDINMEAGRNVNIKATSEYKNAETLHGEKSLFDASGLESGRIYLESAQNMDLLIGRNGKIHVRNDDGIQGNLDVKVLGNMRIAVKDKDNDPTNSNVSDPRILEEQPEEVKGLHIFSYENTRIYTEKNLDISTKGNVKIGTTGNLDLNSKGNNAYTAGGTTDIKSGGNHTETAAIIHMNGPTARTAEVAELAEIADKVRKLPLHENIKTNKLKGWEKKYQDETIDSIMKRIPMHEPWALHENLAPEILKPKDTDREI